MQIWKINILSCRVIVPVALLRGRHNPGWYTDARTGYNIVLFLQHDIRIEVEQVHHDRTFMFRFINAILRLV